MDITNAFIPYIQDFSPTEFMTSVSTMPDISVTFSLDMRAGSYLTTAEASNYLNEYIQLSNRTSDRIYRVEFVSYDAKTHTVVFKPDADLDPGATYTVTVLAGFATTTGRGMLSDYSWKFTTAGTNVAAVTLSGPADASELTESPQYTWNAVDGATYTFQVSDTQTFDKVLHEADGLTDTTLTAYTLATGSTYYWRVRAQVGSVYGAWSTVSSFYLKDPQTIPTAPATIFDTFGVVSAFPPNGASNMQDWPTNVYVRFNKAPGSTGGITVTATHVDTDAAQADPGATFTISNSDIRIAFSGNIQENTRYTIDVSGVTSADGDSLPDIFSFVLTGPYTPLYSSASVLRGEYGRFLKRYTDDEINYQVHRSSIKCNRLVDGNSAALVTDLLTQKNATYDMESYVEAHTAYCLIQSYEYELLEEVGRRGQVDTILAQTDSRLLADIDAILRKLEKEIKQQEISLKGRPQPVTGVKSSSWDPATYYDDQSVALLERPKF